MKTTKNLLAAAAVLTVAMGSQNAMADTAEGTVAVSAELTAACFIGDGTLAFGSFASIAEGSPAGTVTNRADVDADTNAIKYVCSNGATAKLGVAGTNTVSGQLKMTDGTNFLDYDLYSDTGRAAGAKIVPATGGSPTLLDLVANGTDQTITLYGRVVGSTANKPLGTYDDTLTLTVTYN